MLCFKSPLNFIMYIAVNFNLLKHTPSPPYPLLLPNLYLLMYLHTKYKCCYNMHAQSLFSGRREMTILTPGQISVGQIAHYVVAIFEIIMNIY